MHGIIGCWEYIDETINDNFVDSRARSEKRHESEGGGECTGTLLDSSRPRNSSRYPASVVVGSTQCQINQPVRKGYARRGTICAAPFKCHYNGSVCEIQAEQGDKSWVEGRGRVVPHDFSVISMPLRSGFWFIVSLTIPRKIVSTIEHFEDWILIRVSGDIKIGHWTRTNWNGESLEYVFFREVFMTLRVEGGNEK